MAANIDELRKEKERIEREREEIERRLQDAVRREREEEAAKTLPKILELTTRIDKLKQERQDLLLRVREAAPKLGDFTYASEDYRLSLPAARATLRQAELLDRLLAELQANDIHVEPRAPRFRLFRQLRPVGTLHVSGRRLSIAADNAILDGEIIEAARDLDARFPGIAVLELASERKSRRVRDGIAGRLPQGEFAETITFHAADTGSFDAVLPVALRALDHVAAFQEHLTPEEEARLFEPWPLETPAPAPKKS